MTLLLIYLSIAIGVSFLCSVLEAVLLSVTPSYVEDVASKTPGKSKALISVRDRLDESLSSILILNTFAHTMGAAGVGSQATQVFGTQWETVIAIVLTLVILYFSEIIPKTIGATYWRQLAPTAAKIIFWLIRLVYPLIWLATRITKMFKNDDSDEITKDEILALASLGHKSGALATQENEYLANVLRLREVITEHILTPRSVMHALDMNTSVADALNHEKAKQYSRVPVFNQSLDSIQGLITNRALLFAERGGQGSEPISNCMQPITRVSENLPVQQLLDLFLKKREHLFLVEDQYGQTAGIVTLEDAIETMLGREIIDETDTIEDLQAYAKGQYRDKKRLNKN